MSFFGLPWDCAAILIALAVLPTWRGKTRVHEFLSRPESHSFDRLAMYRSTIAFQWVAAGVTIWRVHAHRWDSAMLGLIFGRVAITVGTAVGLSILLAAVQIGGLMYAAAHPEARRGIAYQMLRKLMPQSSGELPLFTVLLVTVSLCEEFLYRGFALAAFDGLFRGSTVAAIGAAAILFAIGHVYQGRQGVVSTFILGVIFGTARVWTGSLLPGVLAHFVTDGLAGIAGPRMLRRADSKAEGREEAVAP